MNLTRCENGHFYDADRFDTCPHCNQTTLSTVLQDENDEKLYTMPMDGEQSKPDIVIPTSSTEDGAQATIGYFSDIPNEPVVGWLVAIEGPHFGQDYKLKTGRNFVGRSSSMDVVLDKDASISREKHAIVLYEPKSNIFLVQPGDAKELSYLNDKVVLTATELKAYDVLSLGGTKLLFIPCCSDKFNWDSVKPAEEK